MKLDLKNDSAYVFHEVSRLLGIAPLLTLLAAAFMLVMAIFTLKDFMYNRSEEAKSLQLPQFNIQSRPVSKKLYEDYAATLARLSPAVSVTANQDALLISISSQVHYPEFMYVLNSIQGVSKNVIWRADEICLAGCSGASATAKVKGLTESVEVSLRGNENEQ